MVEVFKINARGHVNITALHNTTLEWTAEEYLTPAGDCIIGIMSNKVMKDLPSAMKERLRREDTILEILLECGGIKEKVIARGHPELTLAHPTDWVVRKSDFICTRTLAIKANKAACDLDRKLVEKLREGLPLHIQLRLRYA